MNIRKLKALLWMLCFMALLGAGYTFYYIWDGKQQQRYTARSPTYFHDLIQSKVGEVEDLTNRNVYYTPERYQGLWLARIDGSLPPEPEQANAAGGGADAEEQAFVLPPISSILKVGLIVYADQPIDRFIALSYTDPTHLASQLSKQRRLHISEGQLLKAPYDAAPYFGKVLSIAPQTVTFQWGDKEEVVTPGLGQDGAQAPISEWTFAELSDPSADLDEMPEESVELEPGMWVIGRTDLLLIQEDASRILREDLSLRTIPPKGEGKRSVLELTKVEPGSLPDRYGFASGDRLISVNGIPMVSEASATNWYKQNSNLPAYHVIYERLGAQKTMTIYNKNN